MSIYQQDCRTKVDREGEVQTKVFVHCVKAAYDRRIDYDERLGARWAVRSHQVVTRTKVTTNENTVFRIE